MITLADLIELVKGIDEDFAAYDEGHGGIYDYDHRTAEAFAIQLRDLAKSMLAFYGYDLPDVATASPTDSEAPT